MFARDLSPNPDAAGKTFRQTFPSSLEYCSYLEVFLQGEINLKSVNSSQPPPFQQEQRFLQ